MRCIEDTGPGCGFSSPRLLLFNMKVVEFFNYLIDAVHLLLPLNFLELFPGSTRASCAAIRAFNGAGRRFSWYVKCGIKQRFWQAAVSCLGVWTLPIALIAFFLCSHLSWTLPNWCTVVYVPNSLMQNTPGMKRVSLLLLVFNFLLILHLSLGASWSLHSCVFGTIITFSHYLCGNLNYTWNLPRCFTFSSSPKISSKHNFPQNLIKTHCGHPGLLNYSCVFPRHSQNGWIIPADI